METMINDAPATRRITVTVNGRQREGEVPVRQTLADFLRQGLGLTGTHLGCEHGVCGACTILLDGRAGPRLPAARRPGRWPGGDRRWRGWHLPRTNCTRCRNCSATHHGLQCGFCTPGLLMTLVEFLRDCPAPSPEDVRIAISGNICRCTGYESIVAATLEAATRMRAATTEGAP